MSRGWAVRGIAVLVLAGCASGAARAENAATAATLRIGLVGTLFPDVPEPMIQVLAKPFRSLMEDQAGVVGVVSSGGDADNLARQLKEERVHLGVFHGHEF